MCFAPTISSLPTFPLSFFFFDSASGEASLVYINSLDTSTFICLSILKITIYHRLNGHGFGCTLGVGDGQGGLVCSSSWGCKEWNTTEQLNWTEFNICAPKVQMRLWNEWVSEVTQLCPTLCDPMDCSLSGGAIRLLHPWDSPGKNTGVGCRFLLQKIFLIQGLNAGLPHCRQTLYLLSHQGSQEMTTHSSTPAWKILWATKFRCAFGIVFINLVFPPWWLSSKESACQAGDSDSIPR